MAMNDELYRVSPSEMALGEDDWHFARLSDVLQTFQSSMEEMQQQITSQAGVLREVHEMMTSQGGHLNDLQALQASMHSLLKPSVPRSPMFSSEKPQFSSGERQVKPKEYFDVEPAHSLYDSPMSSIIPSETCDLDAAPSAIRKLMRVSHESDGIVRPQNLRDLENQKAVSLRRTQRPSKREAVDPPPVPPRQPEQVGSPSLPGKVRTPTKARVQSATLGYAQPDSPRMNRFSMEQLRQTHDAAVIGRSGTSFLSVGESAFPCVARFCLCLAGHMRFGDGIPSRVFSFLSFAILPVVLTAVLPLSYATEESSKWFVTMALTLGFFQLGVSCASFSFSRNQVDLLLGPTERQLDDYAEERGFMKSWQALSRRRLIESICSVAVLALLRIIVNLSFGDYVAGRLAASQGPHNAILSWSLWFLALRFSLLCYMVLHVSAGFELALDRFTVRFFKELDLEEALEEWNVLQATLRQVSGKMSDSLLALGFSSLASVVIFGEQVIQSSDDDMEMVVNWLSRFYPLIIFFLYTLLRAAGVTEKASRVAPLVNSWQFDHGGEDSGMHRGRQYAVQYINQSMAGFYVRGAQLTVPNAQRILYYFAVASFALISRLF